MKDNTDPTGVLAGEAHASPELPPLPQRHPGASISPAAVVEAAAQRAERDGGDR